MPLTSYATVFERSIIEFLKAHPRDYLLRLIRRIDDMIHIRGIDKSKFDASAAAKLARRYSDDPLVRCQQLIHALGVNLLSQQDVGYLLLAGDDAFDSYIEDNESVMEMIAACSE